MTVHPFPISSDPSRPTELVKWVRVTCRRPDGFVEFDFAIGDPDLAVNLLAHRRNAAGRWRCSSKREDAAF